VIATGEREPTPGGTPSPARRRALLASRSRAGQRARYLAAVSAITTMSHASIDLSRDRSSELEVGVTRGIRARLTLPS